MTYDLTTYDLLALCDLIRTMQTNIWFWQSIRGIDLNW